METKIPNGESFTFLYKDYERFVSEGKGKGKKGKSTKPYMRMHDVVRYYPPDKSKEPVEGNIDKVAFGFPENDPFKRKDHNELCFYGGSYSRKIYNVIVNEHSFPRFEFIRHE